MGKAVPKNIKRMARDLIELYPDKFSGDYEKNKGFINSLDLPISKDGRNHVAGYIGRMKISQASKP